MRRPEGPKHNKNERCFLTISHLPLFAFQVPLWSSLGPSWTSLGPSWAPLGVSWAFLGVLRGPFGGLWGPRALGALVTPLEGHLEPSWGCCEPVQVHLVPSWAISELPDARRAPIFEEFQIILCTISVRCITCIESVLGCFCDPLFILQHYNL